MSEANPTLQRRLIWLKRWIWIYFWLLIFEGALRKWVFPSYSGELLVIRDPVVLLIYAQAYRCQKFSMKTMWPFGILAAGISLLAGAQIVEGINTLPIALYGMRSYVLHLPLIFVIAETLTGEDLRRFGRWLLALSIPMMVLVLAQFRAPGSAWLNAGAGAGASQIMTVGNHVRPAGTFSYGVGMTGLVVLTAGFIFDALMRKGTYPRWLLYPALFATVASIPLLGSRAVLFTMAALGVFTAYSGLSNVARLAGLGKICAVLLLACFVAIQFPFFNDAVTTMSERWQAASKSEGGVQEVLNSRVLGTFESGIAAAGRTPWLGSGIGMGSSFAAFLTNGEASFMLGESEWERVVLEMGPIGGLLFMGARLCFAGYMLIQALTALRRNSPLAWLLVPGAVPLLVLSIMEQPTYLGFMVFGAGLCLAAAQMEQPAEIYAEPAAAQSVHPLGGGYRRTRASE